mgnify:CR=1 FL=1
MFNITILLKNCENFRRASVFTFSAALLIQIGKNIHYEVSFMDKKDIKKVVLAYSGGLDTSIIIPWLKENYLTS